MNRDNRRLRLVFALLVVTSLTLLTLDLRGGRTGGFASARRAVGSVTGPVERGISGLFRPVGRAISAAVHSGRDQQRIDALTEQLTKERLAHDRDAELKRDTPTLQKLGVLEYYTRTTGVFARVLGRGDAVDGYEQTAHVDVGSVDGVVPGQPVVDQDGLVGLVKRTTAHDAWVVLLTDPGSNVSVDDGSGRLAAYVTGRGPGQPLAYTQTAPAAQLRSGTVLYTAQGSQYDKGIPVGTVGPSSVSEGGTTQVAFLRPVAAIDSSSLLDVLTSQRRDAPRKPLLAVSPVPAPSAVAPGGPSVPAPVPAPVGSPTPTATAPASRAGGRP